MIQDFPNGKLWLSSEPIEAVARETSWAHDPEHSIVMIVTVVLMIIFIRDFFILWTPVFKCLFRPKAIIEIEHSVQLARTRNRVALLAALPFSLIAERFTLISESMWYSLLIILGYHILRRIIAEILPKKRISTENWTAVRCAVYNFAIMLSALMLLTVGVWVLFRWDVLTMKYILMGETGAMFLLCLIRENQILTANYHPFLAFLYLCALELVPAAALVATALFIA